MTFPDFLSRFFALFAGSTFNGREYLAYLDAPQTGDEAAIVDNAVTAPLLGLLGFAPGEQVYNLAKNGDRPDFAPELPGTGTCFYVEDKNTSLAVGSTRAMMAITLDTTFACVSITPLGLPVVPEV